MNRFEGKVVLVTGAARGIGWGTASRFAAEGASVALLDLDGDAAEDAAASLVAAQGGRAIGIGADVTDSASVQAAVDRTAEVLGGLDVLVNNAGITRDNLVHRMSEDEWDQVVDVHLKGAFLMSKAAQVHFVRQRSGRIVNLSSVSALGTRGQVNYSAAKMGIQGMTRTLAIELGPYGVCVNAVAPGFIATEMTDATAARLGLSVEEFRQSNAEVTPLRRVGQPDDVAGVIAFLSSEDAAYVTGQTLYVDGGVILGG
ncbi:SDR family oxidoreductase [Marmoricola sp. RAF53]|uniref:SDR family oxidoreductase n=1 Tax=Marmoricola sp. RAF53 TaxID=3233059 RepID=UPI003F94A1AA